MHRVVITGMGMSTSLGPDLRTCWQRLLAGDSGIAPLSFWDPSEYNTKVVAEVKHVPRDTGAEWIPAAWCRRGVRLFLPVAREALADAQLARAGEGPQGLAPTDIGIAVGSSVNYLDMALMKHYFQLRKPDSPALDMARFAREGRQPDNSFYRRLGDMIASVPAKLLKLAGPAFVMDTACAASSHAIGEAFRLVRLGKVKAMLAGGAAALVSPLPILAFSLLGALSRNANPELASRPFDRQRDGFVMGEGGGAVVLETLAAALARKKFRRRPHEGHHRADERQISIAVGHRLFADLHNADDGQRRAEIPKPADREPRAARELRDAADGNGEQQRGFQDGLRHVVTFRKGINRREVERPEKLRRIGEITGDGVGHARREAEFFPRRHRRVIVLHPVSHRAK